MGGVSKSAGFRVIGRLVGMPGATWMGVALLALVGAALAACATGADRGEDSGAASGVSAVEASAGAARGAELYATHCASCHGASGEGQANWRTQNADGSYPAPPHDRTGHTWHHSDALLLELIRDGGGRYESATFKSRMPAFGDRLDEADRLAVLAFLKTLWGPDERRQQAEVSPPRR